MRWWGENSGWGEFGEGGELRGRGREEGKVDTPSKKTFNKRVRTQIHASLQLAVGEESAAGVLLLLNDSYKRRSYDSIGKCIHIMKTQLQGVQITIRQTTKKGYERDV